MAGGTAMVGGTAGTDLARRPATHRNVLLILALVLLLAIGRAYLAIRDRGSGPVYTVAGARAGLASAPRAWQGRTVRVRGILVALSIGCPQDTGDGYPVAALRESGALRADTSYLPVAAGPPDGLRARLGTLPLIGPLLGPPQPVWGVPTIFNVRLRAWPSSHCWSPGWGAVLLDAAQSARPDEPLLDPPPDVVASPLPGAHARRS